MKLDSSETPTISLNAQRGALNGICISEPKNTPGLEMKTCNTPHQQEEGNWSYLHVHNSKVKSITEQLEHDKMFPYFVHCSTQHIKRGGKTIAKERHTVGGLVFLQGDVQALKQYLNDKLPDLHLVNDCATHRTAVIPHSQMIPFMRIMQQSPENIRILLKPFEQYAKDNTLLRITTGPMQGMQGYIIRINRNRHLVMNIGGLTIAIGNIHKEMFEVVEE